MFKKSMYLLTVLLITIALVFSACTTTAAPAEEAAEEPAEAEETTEEEPCLTVGVIYVGSVNDAGFNQAMHDSAVVLTENLPCVELIEAENVPEGPDATRVMQTMIDQGAKLIIPTSFGHMEYAYDLSFENPDVYFEHAGGYLMGDNFANFFGKPPETFYIMGVAAGLMTESNKLGFVASQPLGWTLTFINAFTLGAQSVNPDVETIVTFTFSWSDSAKEADATNAMINQGVDVVTMHVDATGTVIQTAESRGVYSIGYQSLEAQQFAPEYWISGAGFTFGDLFTFFANGVIDGTWEPIFLRCGVADGCMAIAPFGPKVPQDVQDQVNTLIDEMNAGTLVVFEGPIVDQDGTVRIPEGEVLSDEDMGNVDWFVKGVIGSPQ